MLFRSYFGLFFKKNPLNKQNFILFIGILTTQSTGAFFGLIFLIFSFFLIKNKDVELRFIILSFVIPITIIATLSLSFLSEKITSQVIEANEYVKSNDSGYNSQRFISTFVDFKDFLNKPIFGTGPSEEARFKESSVKDSNIRTNGVMDLLVKFGTVGFVFYFWSLYKNINLYSRTFNFKKNITIIFIILLLIIGSSQNIFYYPFFWALSMGIDSSNFGILFNYRNKVIKYKKSI